MIVKFLTISVANEALEKRDPVRLEQIAAEEEKISNVDMDRCLQWFEYRRTKRDRGTVVFKLSCRLEPAWGIIKNTDAGGVAWGFKAPDVSNMQNYALQNHHCNQ